MTKFSVYLQAVLKRILQNYRVPEDKIELNLRWDESRNVVQVSSPSVEIRPLVEELAVVRDFFNTVALYLKYVPKVEEAPKGFVGKVIRGSFFASSALLSRLGIRHKSSPAAVPRMMSDFSL